MSDETNYIYVIVRDGGYDGKSGPIQAFRYEHEARGIAALMSSSESFVVYAVPIWPDHQERPWFNLEPLPPKDEPPASP